MAELSVSRKNIEELFTDIKNEIFIIPEYQRPYRWDIEKCDILWNDIVSFHKDNKDKDDDYFLGTIVTCKTDNGFEIIDGQQRITSLFLLLRAFYKKLDSMANQEDRDVVGLKSQIAPCIWDVNKKSKIVEDYSKIHIYSKVATEKDNDVFHGILKDGKVRDCKSQYAVNYRFFLDKCNEFAENEPLEWQNLCLTILYNCIILPIECDTIDSALTIFSTLNDRGMPLSDADIFKAQIYKQKVSEEEKEVFTNDWKELSEIVEEAALSLNDIFRYYSHVIRSQNKDKSKEIGLRRFYADANYKNLKDPNLIDDLIKLARFWKSIYQNESKYLNDDSRKYLQLLYCYPNEYWRYITSVFYIHCVDNNLNVIEELVDFWKKLSSYLYIKFIHNPTVNAIKDSIYSNCINVYYGNPMDLEAPVIEDLERRIALFSSSRITKGLLYVYAYSNPAQALLNINYEIEHILPKKWQEANYNGWTLADAKEFLDKFGNKVLIEKRVNIQAGNGYFGKKKDIYKKSKVVELQLLAHRESNDWLKDDINNREKQIVSSIVEFLYSNLS